MPSVNGIIASQDFKRACQRLDRVAHRAHPDVGGAGVARVSRVAPGGARPWHSCRGRASRRSPRRDPPPLPPPTRARLNLFCPGLGGGRGGRSIPREVCLAGRWRRVLVSDQSSSGRRRRLVANRNVTQRGSIGLSRAQRRFGARAARAARSAFAGGNTPKKSNKKLNKTPKKRKTGHPAQGEANSKKNHIP